MEINLTEPVRKTLQAFILIILPLIVFVLGIVFVVENVWYYVLSITWFGSGIIFFNAIN
jgi:hypothetical protein